MSIAFTLTATDGVVVIADGRTTVVSIENDSDPVPETDVAVKMTLAPHGLPFVIAYTGRASIGGTRMCNLVDRFLKSFAKEEFADLSLREVITRLRAHLDEVAELAPAMYEDETSAPVHVLVAGYRPGSDEFEVWRSVGRDPRQVAPERDALVFCGLRDDRPDGESAEDRVLVLFDDEYRVRQEQIDDYRTDGDYYLLRGHTMAEVVASAVASLSADVEQDPGTYGACGVGGVWRLASVSPNGAPSINCFHIGPMLAGDARVAGAVRDQS